MQLYEIPQNASFYLKKHNFTMGSVRAVPNNDMTFWGSLSNISPTSYRTELAVSLYQHENRISLKYHQQETCVFQLNVRQKYISLLFVKSRI